VLAVVAAVLVAGLHVAVVLSSHARVVVVVVVVVVAAAVVVVVATSFAPAASPRVSS